jgi:hypothetical protein
MFAQFKNAYQQTDEIAMNYIVSHICQAQKGNFVLFRHRK